MRSWNRRLAIEASGCYLTRHLSRSSKKAQRMAQWDDGYVTDVAYTSNFYREITPSWLAMTSLLLGQRPPDLTKPFGYADLGCGNGRYLIGSALALWTAIRPSPSSRAAPT